MATAPAPAAGNARVRWDQQPFVLSPGGQQRPLHLQHLQVGGRVVPAPRPWPPRCGSGAAQGTPSASARVRHCRQVHGHGLPVCAACAASTSSSSLRWPPCSEARQVLHQRFAQVRQGAGSRRHAADLAQAAGNSLARVLVRSGAPWGRWSETWPKENRHRTRRHGPAAGVARWSGHPRWRGVLDASCTHGCSAPALRRKAHDCSSRSGQALALGDEALPEAGLPALAKFRRISVEGPSARGTGLPAPAVAVLSHALRQPIGVHAGVDPAEPLRRGHRSGSRPFGQADDPLARLVQPCPSPVPGAGAAGTCSRHQATRSAIGAVVSAQSGLCPPIGRPAAGPSRHSPRATWVPGSC